MVNAGIVDSLYFESFEQSDDNYCISGADNSLTLILHGLKWPIFSLVVTERQHKSPGALLPDVICIFEDISIHNHSLWNDDKYLYFVPWRASIACTYRWMTIIEVIDVKTDPFLNLCLEKGRKICSFQPYIIASAYLLAVVKKLPQSQNVTLPFILLLWFIYLFCNPCCTLGENCYI